MSTLRAATLSNVAGTGSPDFVGGELCRARFRLNGTGTIAALDTFNISSFIDQGVGNYTATFATAFPNADYTSLVTGDSLATSARYGFLRGGDAAPSVNNVRIGLVDGTLAGADGYAACSFFGDIP